MSRFLPLSKNFCCLMLCGLAAFLVLLPVSTRGQDGSTADKISQLTGTLQTGDEKDRQVAAYQLSRIGGKDVVPGLILGLKANKSNPVLTDIAAALCNSGDDAVEPIISTLEENERAGNNLVLRHGANALACIAEATNNANPALARVVPTLIRELQNRLDDDRAAMLIFATEEKPPQSDVDQVNAKLEGFDGAAHCLGRLGRWSKDALPILMEIAAIESRRTDGYRKSDAINLILRDLISFSDTSANENIRNAFKTYHDGLTEKDQGLIGLQIKLLDNIEIAKKWSFSALFHQYWFFLIPMGLIAVWLLLYFLKPIWLLELYEALPLRDVRLNGLMGAITIPLEYVFAAISLRPRSLDAWVKKYISDVRSKFAKKPTVKDRQIYVPVGLFVDKQLKDNFSCDDLRSTFAQNQSRILIAGVGGAGKTSLGCQIAQWGMDDKEIERLCAGHLMMPILLEQDFADAGEDALLKSIASQLSDISDLKKPISTALLQALLKNKRVLVLIDGMSEMNDASRAAIISGLNRIPVNAAIVTSRTDDISQLRKTVLKPTRIRGNQISSFVEAYLVSLGKKELFEDEEFFEGCRLLSLIVGDRDITALLAKLFVELMVAKQEKTIDEVLPRNIPQLMLRSVELLYPKKPSPTDPKPGDLIEAATIIAWECLKKDFRPLAADYHAVRQALKVFEDGEKCLDFLLDKLKLIETTSFGRKIRFRIDPLAEYLAAAYVVTENADNKIKWRTFLSSAESHAGTSGNIKGFLLAVLDWCKAEPSFHVPETVLEKLEEMTRSK